MVYKGEKFISCIGTNYKCPESGMIDYVSLNLVVSQFSFICLGIKQPSWYVLYGAESQRHVIGTNPCTTNFYISFMESKVCSFPIHSQTFHVLFFLSQLFYPSIIDVNS